MENVADIFSKRLHPFLYAALKSGEHPDYNPRALYEEQKRSNGKKVRRLPHVRDFQLVLEETLWTILVQQATHKSKENDSTTLTNEEGASKEKEAESVNTKLTSSGSAEVPLRVPYPVFQRCMDHWLEQVVGGDSNIISSHTTLLKAPSPSHNDSTEFLFVQICTSILLYTTRFRHLAAAAAAAAAAEHSAKEEKANSALQSSTPAKADTSLPPGVVAVAKAIPAAILSLRRRCVFNTNTADSSSETSANGASDKSSGLDTAGQKQEVKKNLKLLWLHFLFIFSQQLMTVFSISENDAWNRFCASCLSDTKASQNFFSTSFSDDEDSDDEQEDEETTQEVLEALRQSPTSPRPLPKVGDPLVLSEETQKECLLFREAVGAWANDLPPNFLSDALAKARVRRVLLLSRSCVPHHVMQTPDATLSLLQLIEGFVQEWNDTLHKLPIGFLSSSSRRRKYFPGYENVDVAVEKLGDARDLIRRVPTGKPSVKEEEQSLEELSTETGEEIDNVHFKTLEYLASLPHQYAEKISALVGKARMHTFLLVSVLVSVLMTQYILPQRSLFISGNLAPPSKYPTLMEMIRCREKAVLWIRSARRDVDTRTALERSQSTEPPADELEWQWRYYCPLGMLFSANSPFPVQSFLISHLVHIVTSAYRIGPTPTAHMEARQRIVMVSVLCGLLDVPKALLLYHLAVKPSSTPPVAAGGNAGAAAAATSASTFSLPTASLRGYTNALNTAVRAAETQMIMQSSSPSGIQSPPSYYNYPRQSGYARGDSMASKTTEKPLTVTRMTGDKDDERWLDEDEEEEEVLVDGQVEGKRFHEMVYPVPIPSPNQWLSIENTGGAAANSSSATSAAPNMMLSSNNNSTTSVSTDAVENHLSPISFVLDFLLSRYTNIASQAMEYLHHDLALPLKSAASLPCDSETTSVHTPTDEAITKTLSNFSPLSSSIEIPKALNPSTASGSGSGASDVPMPVNLFLVPRSFLPSGVTIQSAILVLLEEQLGEWEKRESAFHCSTSDQDHWAWEGWWKSCGQHQLCGLQALVPLLAEANSFMADQMVLSRLIQRLDVFSRQVWCFASSTMAHERAGFSPIMDVVRHALSVSEYIVIHLVMPCMRMLAPSPVVYDELFRLMQSWEEIARSGATLYGEQQGGFLHITEWSRQENLLRCRLVGEYADIGNGGPDPENRTWNNAAGSSQPTELLPCRHPHDYLRCKEQQALFQQSMKRINMKNTRFYSRLLTPVFYAQPLFTIEKLLQQAVGYKNNFLDVHQRLLSGVPAAFIVLLLHRGLSALASYASEEQVVGSDLLRTAVTARFLAVMARSQHQNRLLPLRLLVRSVEHALRRYTRADHVYGLELLKAVLYECVGGGLSHEEQYSSSQRTALVSGGWVTSFFASGRGDSFLRNRWMGTVKCTPLEMYETKQALLEVLSEPCPVPLASSLDDNENEEMTEGDAPLLDVFDMEERELLEVRWRGCVPSSSKTEMKMEPQDEEEGVGSIPISCMSRRESNISLGQQLLLHLCQRHASLNRLQADLEGKMEEVLLTNAKETDTLADLIFVIDGLLQEHHQVQEYYANAAKVKGPQGRENQSILGEPIKCGVANDLLEDAALPLLGLRLRQDAESQRCLKSPPPLLSTPTASFKPTTEKRENGEEEALDLLQDQLSFFVAGHLSFEPSCYQEAAAEIKVFHQFWCSKYKKKSARYYLEGHNLSTSSTNTNNNNNASSSVSTKEVDRPFCPPVFRLHAPAAPSDQEEAFLEWCHQRVVTEEAAHRKLYQESEPARQHLVEMFRSLLVEGPNKVDPVVIATDVLVPRLVLSTPDAVFVEKLVCLLWRSSSKSSETTTSSNAEPSPFRKALIAMIFSMVSAYFSFFVGFTSSECRRIGYFLSAVVELLAGDPSVSTTNPLDARNERKRLDQCVDQFMTSITAISATSNKGTSGTSASHVTSPPGHASALPQKNMASQLLYDTSVGKSEKDGVSVTQMNYPGLGWAVFSALSRDSSAPSSSIKSTSAGRKTTRAQPGDILKITPCYPTQFSFYVSDAVAHLLTSLNAPSHTKRNVLLVLERLPLEVFPPTVACIDVLLSALRPHMDKGNPNSPSAMAAVKRLLSNRTKLKERQTSVGQNLLHQVLYANSTPLPSPVTSEDLQHWFALCMSEENYARRLLRERENNGETFIEPIDEMAEEMVREAAEALAAEEEEEERAKQARDNEEEPEGVASEPKDEGQAGTESSSDDGDGGGGDEEEEEEDEDEDEEGSFSDSSSRSGSPSQDSISSHEEESDEEGREPMAGNKRARSPDREKEHSGDAKKTRSD